MTRRGPADLPSGPGKPDMKPAGRLPGAAACRSPAGPGLIASAAAGEVRAVACLPAAIADPPDCSATGIPQDRLPVRSGMDRLINSKISLVQIPPPSSARSAHTPVDRRLVQPPVRLVQTRCQQIRQQDQASRGVPGEVTSPLCCPHCPVTTPAATGLLPRAFARKMRAGRARGPARRPRCGDARRASGTGDACASESPKHVTSAHQAGCEAAQV